MEDTDLEGFLRTFRDVADLAKRTVCSAGAELFSDAVSAHLGRPARELAIVTEEFATHRFTDWDTALALLAGRDPDARELGVGGGDSRFHHKLTDFIEGTESRYVVGQVDYVSLPVAPTEHRRAIGLGMRLFRYAGQPVGVLQRRADPRYPDESSAVEVICADVEVAGALLAEARTLSVERSVLRGQVITFDSSPYVPELLGVTFLRRPDVTADQVVLPERALERIVAHVVGVAEQADVLRRHGQHLKRGLLLHGPPGTGKTHTVRHLLGRTPGHTVVVLAGGSLNHVSLAANLARTMQPAVVVLEDCDLVAEDRDFDPDGRPLLFEVLDAIDGLDEDADVTFLLTTNRATALERALVQRPGRVDLAVEIPLPDLEGRRRLLDLYRGPVDYGQEVLEDAARRTEGMTASFMKELMRRAVLEAAVDGVEPDDAHLRGALEAMLHGQEELTRALLGDARGIGDDWDEDDDWDEGEELSPAQPPSA